MYETLCYEVNSKIDIVCFFRIVGKCSGFVDNKYFASIDTEEEVGGDESDNYQEQEEEEEDAEMDDDDSVVQSIKVKPYQKRLNESSKSLNLSKEDSSERCSFKSNSQYTKIEEFDDQQGQY